MENQNTGSSLFELTLNDNLKNSLSGAAKWAGVVGILTLINSIVGLVQYFILKNRTPKYQQFEGFESSTNMADSGGNLISAIISLLISGLIFYFLNRFSNHTKSGINGNNPDMVSSGLQGLSSYFILTGVIIIIVLVIVLLAMLGLAAGGTR
jgi:hypothetical protein